MKTKTQYDLIFKLLKRKKYITPALMGGNNYYGVTAGSELTRRCRELRELGILGSFREILPHGKQSRFVSFYKIK